MGKIQSNIITKGFSGKYSEDLMFRQFKRKTIFSRIGASTKPPTARQLEIRNKFTEASLFASAAIDNPPVYEDYKKMAEQLDLSSAYVAALTDYSTEPEIATVFTAAYQGEVGQLINILGTMPYKIVDVDVSILRPDGTVLESGKAEAHEEKWRYAATVVNPQVAGSKLVVVARDRRKKETTREVVL